ncbi:hypothetical protein AMAG_02749 [Allomyces macrogynus ATCC 38327]|uniref:Uncharacterized protein n=1 Tax=Allomyces macrogynus (strain ATCC 38327) TaxID=578462 RepID=A0A0L0S3L0_ALLM3|nr:hypothetical protein AMAG_02749 [Allomyces macrogynus ATCC 38327]|eukprot:KNE56986.1 hypothetical protein AMAG_02749 [Allomyces macrogynus ATCC 38327]
MAKKKAQEQVSADKDKPDARHGLVLRLANVVATAIFCRAAYARYSRGYDAETAQWVAFYVMCAINTLANVFPKSPVDPPYMIAYLIGIYNTLGSLQADGIMTPHGLVAPGGAPVAPLDGSAPAASGTTLQAVFDLSTSGGRDRSAVVMTLYWLFLGRVMPRVLSYMLVVGAVAITAAAVSLPAFGYTTLADCGMLPPGHAPVDGGMCAGGAPRTCPFTGKTVTLHDAKPTVEDKCPKGKCKVPGRGDQECIHLGSTNVCGSFVGNYVPLNVSDYFRKRMPTKRYYNIPNLDSAAMFDNLWSTSEDYGFMGKYSDDYMRHIAGCAIPNQRWFKTWFCADLLDHFVDNPCTKPSNFTICADTFTERADSVSADLGNSTACLVGNEGRTLGKIYVSQLKGYSKLSKDANCVSGAATEANDRTLKQCGYTSTWTACNKGCKDVTPEQCARAIREAQNAPAASSSCDQNDVTCNGKGSSKVGMIVGIVVAVFVVIALAVLYHIRLRKTGGEEKPVPAAPEPEVPAAAPAPVARQ